MPRLLALEWDRREARVAVVQTHGTHPVLEYAFPVPLEGSGSDQAVTADELGAQLLAELGRHGVSRLPTLVAVGRASVELKRMALPPAPPEELVELVHFQALKEFQSLSDDWVLDFFTLAGGTDEPHDILAAAIAPRVAAQIVDSCEAAGMSPRRLVLRPCAAAALLIRHAAARSDRVQLLVDRLPDEADLTAVVDRKVVFMRTVRLHGDASPQGHSKALEAEIRRTLAAVHNQLGGQGVQTIYLCGNQRENDTLAKYLHERLSLTVESFDPLDCLALGAQVQAQRPKHPGRFAALIGMLMDEAEEIAPAIDFLQPRRKPQPKSRRPLLVGIGIPATLLIAGTLMWTWSALAALDRDIERLSLKVGLLDADIRRAKDTEDKGEELNKWLASDIVWLDELYELAQDFPDAQDAVVTEVKCISDRRKTGGSIVLKGRVRDYDHLLELEEGLRDARHKVQPQSSSRAKADDKTFAEQFESTIHVQGKIPRKQAPLR